MQRPMKQSGVDWIGDVPVGWEVRRIKDTAVALGKMLTPMQGSSSDVEIPYIRSANVSSGDIGLNSLKKMWFSPSEISRLKVKNTDVLVAEGGNIGATTYVSVIPENQAICFQNSVLRIRTRWNQRYIYFWMNYLKDSGFHNSNDTAVSISHLTKEKLETCPLVIPPIQEQIDIANYLDEVTTTIDDQKALLFKKKELLQEQKKALIQKAVTKGLDDSVAMKPSGVDWIGDVPVGWDISRLSEIANISNGYPFASEDFADSGVPIVKMTNINGEGPFVFYKGPPIANSKQYEIGFGDILFGLSGSIGVTTWKNNIALLNQRLARVRVKRGFNQKFCFYGSQYSLATVGDGLASTTIKNVALKQIETMCIPCPPILEQIAIAKYLDDAADVIDEQCELIEKKIALLTEMRASVIHDAVTKGIPAAH